MKKCISIILVLAVILLCACDASTSAQQQTMPIPQSRPESSVQMPDRGKVFVLYTNDVHCGIEQGIGYTGVAAAKQILEKTGDEVVLVDNGDAVQGELIGTLSNGESIINLMNTLGYDLAVPGNHEFDYGMEQFMHLKSLAKFPYLSANFVDADGNLVLEPYQILEKGGWKIAFIGVCTPKTITTSTPSNFMDSEGELIYGFCQDESGEKLYQAVQDAVDAAKAEGADIVIAMSHLGIAAESSPWTSSELITHTTGIDAVLDAHSHTVMEREFVKNAEGKDVLVSSTGTKLETIGCLTISADGKLETALLDDAAAVQIKESIEQIEELTEAVVAHTDVDLHIMDPATGLRMVRQNETNLGDLCADAYRAIFNADIAIVNAGSVRAEIPKGDITYGDIISVSPFGNEACMVEATGQEILDALELDVSDLPGERGGFPQVSGITFTVNVDIPSGVVVDANGMFVSVEGARRVQDVMVGGEPIDPEKIYTLASTSYILKEGGDGVNMFMDNVFITEGGKLDNQILIEYIVDYLGGVIGEQYADPYGEGRIAILQDCCNKR